MQGDKCNCRSRLTLMEDQFYQQRVARHGPQGCIFLLKPFYREEVVVEDIYLLLGAVLPHGGVFMQRQKKFPFIGESDLAAGKRVLETNSAANMRRGRFELLHNTIDKVFRMMLS